MASGRALGHVPYEISTRPDFFTQAGYGLQHYRGEPYQHGYGFLRSHRRFHQKGHGVLTNLLGRAGRFLWPLITGSVLPIAQTAAKALIHHGSEAGANILQDIAKGESPREAVVTHGTKALKGLAREAGSKLTQAGTGRRKRAKRKRSLSNLHVVGRSVLKSAAKKRRRTSKLGLY